MFPINIISSVFAFLFIFLSTLILILRQKSSSQDRTCQKWTLSNGERTIIFEGVAHVADQSFYDRIRDEITQAEALGFTYLFEGVRGRGVIPGELELYIGFSGDLETLYKWHANRRKLVYQPKHDWFSANATCADATAIEVIEEFKRIGMRKCRYPLSIDDIVAFAVNAKGDDVDLDRAFRLLRSCIFVVPRIVFSKKWKKVVCDFRNAKLLEEIYARSGDIIITYGNAHFEGFMRDLKVIDPRWKIVSVESFETDITSKAD